jgi:hypothetical protein
MTVATVPESRRPKRQVESDGFDIFFGFVSDFVAYGYNTPVDEADVFDVGNFDESLLAKNSAARLHEYWSREVARSSESDDADPPSLITALVPLLSCAFQPPTTRPSVFSSFRGPTCHYY